MGNSEEIYMSFDKSRLLIIKIFPKIESLLDDQIFISFLIFTIVCLKNFFVEQSIVMVKKTPTCKAFIGSFGHLMPSGLLSLFFSEPIHNPSVFELFTLSPDRISTKTSRKKFLIANEKKSKN